MRGYLRTALRGFAIVTLVSMNTRQLAMSHVHAAAMGSLAIQLLWYSNSSKERDNRRGAALAYAFGGALGTYAGFALAAWFGR